ncbi:UDP-glycosyltransferase 83A1 [Striga hermonthica]|uniref:UDP-glycosyltransferase 83A1 n=1 Tax=Striga hermonthica TaxID=68872 RepID=A0A9N7MVH5_STRHE|nr:UDP-glycosyltransferase 83A1 [Striga hermonthica]
MSCSAVLSCSVENNSVSWHSLTGRFFLWVIMQDMISHTTTEEGFRERVGERGMVVVWAPEQEVLSHALVGCFVSHCWWNSTVEGVSSGVLFVCWSCFTEQFANEAYICDEWKIGLRLRKDESGIIRHGEDKLERVLGDEGFKERVASIKAKVLESAGEGNSYNNLMRFIEWIKET